MILLYGVESKHNGIQKDNKKDNSTKEKLLEINEVQNRIVKFTKFLKNIDENNRFEYQKILLSFLLILLENIENVFETNNITKVENCIKGLHYDDMIKNEIIATIKEYVYVDINSIRSEKNGYSSIIPANILSIVNFIFSDGCFINNDIELGEFVNKYHPINPLNMNKCSIIYELLVKLYFSLPELKNKDDRDDKMKEIIKKLKNKAINQFTESMKKYINQDLNDYINSKYKQKKILKENLKNINVIYEVLKKYKENKSDENFKTVLNSFKFDYHALLRSVEDKVRLGVPGFKEIKELIQKSLEYYGFHFDNYTKIKEKYDSFFNSYWNNFSSFCEQNKKSLDAAKNSFDNFDPFYKFYLNIIKNSQGKIFILNKSDENLDIRKIFKIFTTGYQILNYNFESIKHIKHNLESIKINLSKDSELKEFNSQLQLILHECEMEDFINQVEKTVKNNEIYSSNQNI